MKTILFTIVSLYSLGIVDPSKYEQVMLNNIEALNKAKTVEELQEVANAFDRIANVETDKWEPLYYGAYTSLMLAFRADEATFKDKLLDQALEKIDKSKSQRPSDSEIIALEGFIHMIRVTIDPATRGAKFSNLAMQAFDKSLIINPDNPRAMLLSGQMQFGTSRFFGSDTGPACQLIEKALSLFDHDKSENVLAPKWGKGQAKAAMAECQK